MMTVRAGIVAIILSTLFIDARAAHAAESASSAIVLRGATIYDGAGHTVRNGTLIVRGDRIARVGADRVPIPTGADIVDLHGAFIVPGLIDAHVHFGQTGFFEARPDYVDLGDRYPYEDVLAYQKRHPDRYFPAYLGSGVTSVFDVGGAPWTLDLQQPSDTDPASPRIRAAGPMLTPAPESAIARFNAPFEKIMVNLASEEEAHRYIRHMRALGSNGIKLWGVPDGDAGPALLAALQDAKRSGLQLLVHATTLNAAKKAMKFGANVLVHSVEDAPVDDEFIELARRNHILYIPTLTVYRAIENAKGALLGTPLPVDDPRHLLDPRTRAVLDSAGTLISRERQQRIAATRDADLRQLERKERMMARNLRRVHDVGIPIAAGTDAGNPGQQHGLSLLGELEAMQRDGIAARDVLRMATANGARVLRRENEVGTLAAGKLADLVVVDQDPAQDIANLRFIHAVMKGGQWVTVARGDNSVDSMEPSSAPGSAREGQ